MTVDLVGTAADGRSFLQYPPAEGPRNLPTRMYALVDDRGYGFYPRRPTSYQLDCVDADRQAGRGLPLTNPEYAGGLDRHVSLVEVDARSPFASPLGPARWG